MAFDVNAARSMLESGMNEAQDLIRNPSKIDDLLIQMEDALRQMPVAGDTLADIPLMVSMIKSYITKEYTDVSLKVILTIVSAFVYMVKKKDIIPDNILIAGQIDDLAVLKVAMAFVKPELTAYSEWRNARRAEGGMNMKRSSAPAEDSSAESAEKAAEDSSAESAEKAAEDSSAENADKAAEDSSAENADKAAENADKAAEGGSTESTDKAAEGQL